MVRLLWVIALFAGIVAATIPGAVGQDGKGRGISLDASQKVGNIKPFQDGVDDGPLCERGVVDLTKYYRALGIKWVRLHDVPWSYDDAIDINYIFPSWGADPDQPSSYDFVQSDYYMKTITSLGLHSIFRLGYSAEFKTAIHHNTPPESFSKWAVIAAHVVRHYNDGWDHGFHYAIKDWEIWNEPDGHGFWTGTPEQYDQIYAVTAEDIKHHDPSVNVGGPALASKLRFLEQFLSYQQAHHVPVDFVSWHIYTQDPDAVVARAKAVHQLMERYRFGKSPSILDEWNYDPGDWGDIYNGSDVARRFFTRLQNQYGAAFDAAVLMKLQDAPVNIATYYTGTTLFWGLFTSYGAPQKNYYAFLAFRRLLDSPIRISVSPPRSKALTVLAGRSKDGRLVQLLISNVSGQKKALDVSLRGLPWAGPSQYEEHVVDDRYDLEAPGGWQALKSSRLREQIEGPSVVLVSVRPAP